MQKDPSAFLPGSGGSYYDLHQSSRPQPTPPAVAVARVTPVPVALPLLSVEFTENRCTLSKALLAQVPHLKAGGGVLLVPPIRQGWKWFLNTKPAPGMGSTLPAAPRPAMFKVHPMARKHFMRPKSDVQRLPDVPGCKPRLATLANENVFAPLRHFTLGPEVPGHEGLYVLVPVKALRPTKRGGTTQVAGRGNG